MNEVPGAPEPRPHSVRADSLRKTDLAWQARISGGTWAEAAQISGYSSGEHALRAVKAAYGELPTLDRDGLRRLWRDRLERAWRQSISDMADRQPGAVTAAVRVITAAVTLDGLAEPTKVDLRVSDLLQSLAEEMQSAGLG